MDGLVPTVLRKLLDEGQEGVIEVVLLLVLSLLHEDEARRERLSRGLADEDLAIAQGLQDAVLEGLDVLVEVRRRIVGNLLQNEQREDALVLILRVLKIVERVVQNRLDKLRQIGTAHLKQVSQRLRVIP